MDFLFYQILIINKFKKKQSDSSLKKYRITTLQCDVVNNCTCRMSLVNNYQLEEYSIFKTYTRFLFERLHEIHEIIGSGDSNQILMI